MKNMTLINVILDRSGSMSTIADEVVGMYNRFIDEQKNLPDYAEVSLTQFDDLYEETYIRRPLTCCESLVHGKTYQPRGMTALYDAVGKTINKINQDIEKLSMNKRPQRVLFVIITDGHENASREYMGKTIQDLIATYKKERGWDFIFLAAGIDSFAEGMRFGMSLDKCMDFDKSSSGLRSMGENISAYTAQYRATGDNTKGL